MVKLVVIVRCVPEDAYLRSLESPVPVKEYPDEKKFKLVVREPEQWYIGRLANEIKTRYQSTYRRPFGEIKYLKDADDDCDLDPELFVADLLVDEGKAAKDGADQQKTVKVVQEQGRAIRQGSVIPDLTPIHYQPPTRPPIPRFPDILEKRRTEEPHIDNRPNKRRRLDQIEEETNHIVNSIERDVLNGTLNDTGPEAELKQESPELARTWISTGPATVDELELLPEAPTHFKPRSKKNKRGTGRHQDSGLEIRESSAIPQEDQQHQRNENSTQGPDSVVDRFVRQQSVPNAQTPATPHNARNGAQTSGGQAVSMLNSMKSNSPQLRLSASTSANKFRKPVRNVYDYPESDIDDTQMSPRSRASRSRITPKLVPAPFSKSTPRSIDAIHQRNSQQSSRFQESPTQQNRNDEDAMDVDGDEENQLPHLRDQEEVPSHNKPNDEISEADAVKADEAVSHHKEQSFNIDRSSILGSDETWSIQEDGTKTRKKRPRQSRAQRKSTGNVSTPRGSSAASSAKATPKAGDSTQQTMKRKRTVPVRVSDVHSRSEISELDSPGMQLSETLRQSSPATRPSKESSQNMSEAVTKPNRVSEQEQTVGQVKDVERPPDSESDDELDMALMKTPKRTKTKSKAPENTKSPLLKCLSCWTKQAKCDNTDPKCNTCTKNKKNCQIREMTEAEAKAERARRQAEKEVKSSQKSRKKGRKSEPQPSEDVVSATDREDESDDQQNHKAVGVAQSQDTNSRRKSNKTTSKPHRSEKLASASDEDEVSEPESNPRVPKSSQSVAAKSKDKKKPVETPSNPSKSVEEADTNPKNDSSPSDSRKSTAPVHHPRAQVKPSSESKKRVQIKAPAHDVDTSPNVDTKQDIEGKNSQSVLTVEVPSSVERPGPVTPATSKEIQPLQENKSTTRERSMESQATGTDNVLPPGMTQEQYQKLRGSRAGLTDEQRNERKLQIRKMGKDSTPSLRHESSTQDLAERSKQDTSSIKSSQHATPSTQSTSKDRSKPPPSTQPARAPTSVKSNDSSVAAPASAPAKSIPNPPASSASANTKLKLQPANTSAKTKTLNPPFQAHQPHPQSTTQRKSTLPTSLTSKSAPIASPSLSTSKSIKQIRAALESSRSASGANTPQPPLTAAAKIAEMKRNTNTAAAKKGIFSLSDDDDDEDSEVTDEEEDQKVVNKTGSKPVSVTVRRRTPSDSGGDSETSDSEDGEDEDDDEDEDGSDEE